MESNENVGTSAVTVPQATASENGSVARRATGKIEEVAERASDLLWARLRHRPYLATAIAGGLGLAIASAVGVGEIAFGVFAAYATYQMLARREPPSKAFRDATKIEKELIV